MKKYGRQKMRGKPLDNDCYRANCSGIEFYDSAGNAYCGCYGLMDNPDNYNKTCLECGALAWAMNVITIAENGVEK